MPFLYESQELKTPDLRHGKDYDNILLTPILLSSFAVCPFLYVQLAPPLLFLSSWRLCYGLKYFQLTKKKSLWARSAVVAYPVLPQNISLPGLAYSNYPGVVSDYHEYDVRWQCCKILWCHRNDVILAFELASCPHVTIAAMVGITVENRRAEGQLECCDVVILVARQSLKRSPSESQEHFVNRNSYSVSCPCVCVMSYPPPPRESSGFALRVKISASL